LSLSEKRATGDTKLSNFKMDSSNIKNSSSVQQMFNQCLSKSAAANVNLDLSKNFNKNNDKEISTFFKTNKNPHRDCSYFNRKKDDFFSVGTDLNSSRINKGTEIESEIDSYIFDSSDCKSSKNFDFNPNYKVESSLNVNVNLVTYPNYYSNSNNGDKVSSSKNASINLSESSSNYSKNIQNVLTSSGYPATNICNYANININNTLPQIHINPSTNINNQNMPNALNVDFIGKWDNDKKNDLIKNLSYNKNTTKENPKIKDLSILKKKEIQKNLSFQTPVVNL